MYPANETMLPPSPLAKRHGYQVVLSCMKQSPGKLGFLRTFGYPFVLNQRAASNTQTSNFFFELQAQVLEIQQKISETNPVARMKQFGTWLCKTCTDSRTDTESSHTYANHSEQYERKDFTVDCLFDESMLYPGHRKAMIGFLAELLKWVFEYDDSGLFDFSNKLSKKFDEFYPQYHLAPHGDSIKKAAIALYSLWLAVEYHNYPREHREPLKAYLPLWTELSYPRSTALDKNMDQISEYIPIVESFPLHSIERFQAMERLWCDRRNYYAGWELYAIYREGAQLFSTSRNFRWRYPGSKRKSDDILRQLSKQSPAPCIPFLLSPEDSPAGDYLPANLYRIRRYLQITEEVPSDKFQQLNDELQEYTTLSIDARILHFQLYCKMSHNPPQPDYLLSRDNWTYNREIGDFVCDIIRDSFVELSFGARNGSGKCVEKLMTVHSQNEKTAFVIADLIQYFASRPVVQQPLLFQRLLKCYEDTYKRANWTDTHLRIHIANLELIKCHLNLCAERLLVTVPRDQIDEYYRLQRSCEELVAQTAALIQRMKTEGHTDLDSEPLYGETVSQMDSMLPE